MDILKKTNQKAGKAIDNVRVILNKIHLLFVYGKFRASFLHIYSGYLTILGFCYRKKQNDVNFFMGLSS